MGVSAYVTLDRAINKGVATSAQRQLMETVSLAVEVPLAVTLLALLRNVSLPARTSGPAMAVLPDTTSGPGLAPPPGIPHRAALRSTAQRRRHRLAESLTRAQ